MKINFMAGHSHWAKIKYKKAASDAKKGQIFSKIAREITIAVREKGSNPEFNPRLRLALDRAKEVNMPSDNVERAIKRGTGEISGEKLEEVMFEIFGPGGTKILVAGITDNKNRSFAQLRQVLNKHNAKLGSEGSVRWFFKKLASVGLKISEQPLAYQNKEKIELVAIEAGAQDFYWQDNEFYIYFLPEEGEKGKNFLTEQGVKIDSFSLEWVPQENIKLDEKGIETNKKFLEELDELDFVQEIYINLDL
ncbi:MAG: YebC/PmpR family DNA-binding transcriptional regulator [Minisyncoccales bacterium]